MLRTKLGLAGSLGRLANNRMLHGIERIMHTWPVEGKSSMIHGAGPVMMLSSLDVPRYGR